RRPSGVRRCGSSPPSSCSGGLFFFSTRRRHTRSVSAFLLNRSSDPQNGRSLNELNRGQSGLETYGLFSNLTHDFLPISGGTASDSDSNPRSFKMSTRESLP